MADFATLGAFVFDGAGASIVGEPQIGELPRTIQMNTNCLAAEPVQTVAFTSGYMQVTLPVKLAGRDTIGETAVEHLRRMLTNLKTEVAKDSNTLTIEPAGWPTPLTYRVVKNEPFAFAFEPITQSRSVMRFDLTLNCLP